VRISRSCCRTAPNSFSGWNHPLWPTKPTQPYAVLGTFLVTDIWSELDVFQTDHDPVRVWCIRFEKATPHVPSWWYPNPHPAFRAAPKMPGRLCNNCGTPSKEIFTAGWACLNHECHNFFVFGGSVDVTSLKYSQMFFDQRAHFYGEVPPVKPQPPNSKIRSKDRLYGSEKTFRVGMCCPRCGCCSSRREWLSWECENENCSFKLSTPMIEYPEEKLDQEVRDFNNVAQRIRRRNKVLSDPIACTLDDSVIRSRNFKMGLYQFSQYIMPDAAGGVAGSITVIRACPMVCDRPGGPNEIFAEMSTRDVGLRRNIVTAGGSKYLRSPSPIAQHLNADTSQGRHEGWTRHFAQNWVCTLSAIPSFL
jgi:hypothetical protein